LENTSDLQEDRLNQVPADSTPTSFQGGSQLLLPLALLPGWFAFATLAWLQPHRAWPNLILPPFLLTLAVALADHVLRRRLPGHDQYLLPVVAFLGGIGLAFTARLAPAYLVRQTTWWLLSLTLMIVLAVGPRDLRWLRRYRYTWLLGGLILVALTLIWGVAPSGSGPRLWLGFGGWYFQPSELLKLLFIAFLSSYLADRREFLVAVRARLAYLGPLLVVWICSLLLLAWQEDLGAGFLFFGLFLAMLYAASGQRRYIAIGIGLAALGAVAAYFLVDRVAVRVNVWLHPWADPLGAGYQIVQGLLAFGRGGLWGIGLGRGSPELIPFVHTDYVLAAATEELGLVGAMGLVIAYAVLVGRSFRIALRAREPFGQLLASGLVSLIALQVLAIAGGNLTLIPLTGVTLPFMSYGGSSLLVLGLGLGLLLRLSTGESEGYGQPLALWTMSSSLKHLAATALLALVMIAIALGYWGLAVWFNLQQP